MQNESRKYNILGVNIDSLGIKQSLSFITNAIKNKEHFYITKPYVEFLTKARDDSKIRNILNKSNLCLADGVSLQWASSYLYSHRKVNIFISLLKIFYDKKWLQSKIPERIGGINLTLPLLKIAQEKKYKIAIIGGPKNTQMTYQNILKLFKNLNLVGVWSGYFDPKDGLKIAQDIGKHKPDIVFVAMGFYKQEVFISKYLNQLNCHVAIGEGGSFDFTDLGGKLKRAPKWVRKINLEWFWRLVLQPNRIKRQLAIPRFIYSVYRQKHKNPYA